MYQIVDILGSFGDNKSHYIEEVYEVIRLAYPQKRLTVKDIHKTVKKYLDYGLLRKEKDDIFKGYFKVSITTKGLEALEYYRNGQGYKRLEQGILKNPIGG
jgi:Lhr-like helicase